jgi:glycine oxidase
VIGGGAIGLGIAWRCAQGGASVTVLDDDPGGGASWAAAGLLAPVTEVHYGEEALLQLNLESARRYPGFIAELEEATGNSAGFRACGTVIAARDSDDNAALDELFAFHRRLGLASERLGSKECRALEPALAPTVRGGIFAADDHQVDNRALVGALIAGCERAGVEFDRRRAVRMELTDERVSGVSTSDGETIAAGTIVIAAGSHSGSLEGLPSNARPPVRPVKGQLMHLRGPSGDSLLNHNVRGLDVYLVARGDGRVVVGATVEERGFDDRVTAEGVHDLLRYAYELVPGIVELELTETVVGFRPGTPDNAPLIGRTVIDGLAIATGHYRNGILLTPVTADAMAALLLKGEEDELVAPFSPRRFDTMEVAS